MSLVAFSAADHRAATWNVRGRTHLYHEAKFIQKWDGHANTYCGGASGLHWHVGICADAAYATNGLCDRSDYALCLCYCPFESLLPVIRAK